MIAVVGIVALLLAISIPGVTRAWEERKVAQTVTIVRGLLMSTRAQAMRTGERGLFFFVDPATGSQRIAPIVADPPVPGGEFDLAINPPTPIAPPITDAVAVNRFRVDAGDLYTLPVPIRVAPRDLVDTFGSGSPPKPFWPEGELAWDRMDQTRNPEPAGSLKFPRSRNYFSMIFGPDGKLLVGRDVLIHDADAQPFSQAGTQGDNRGDRTGLFVEEANQYYTLLDPNGDDRWDEKSNIDPTGGGGKLFDMVVETSGASTNLTSLGNALNFRSVDGLLVYDDSVLADIPEDTATPDGRGTDGKRGYLIREGIPIYIARQTGEIVEGPKGEGTP